METKQQTHLPPEEVQYFIDKGVNFGETQCVWHRLVFGYTKADWTLRPSFKHAKPILAHDVIPAPNLQEVLDVLPGGIYEELIPHGKQKFFLNIYRLDGFWYMEYCNNRIKIILENVYSLQNPLDCAIQLLRWVCKNHPDLVKGGDK